MAETIVLGGGCFWCIEAVYKLVNGVESTMSGYSGGVLPNPSYEQIHIDNSGHAEVVKITFNPKVISLSDILKIFFSIHDPTTLNRQGNDIGPQYRSVIFYTDDSQIAEINSVINNFAKQAWTKPLTTQISKLNKFYPAEDYHQDFFKKNPQLAYCQVVINPKLKKFKQKFSKYLK